MMIGIITAVLFLLVCLRTVEKRLLKTGGILARIHVPVSVALILVMIVHFVSVISLLTSRPIVAQVMGLLALLAILVAVFSGIKKQWRWHRMAAVCAFLFIIMHLVLNIAGLSAYQNKVKNTAIGEIDLSKISDGTYLGEYNVTYIYAKVEVTVAANKIKNITILEHRNDRGAAAEVLVDQMQEEQRIDVDAVSHATNSSTVIKKAVENALKVED